MAHSLMAYHLLVSLTLIYRLSNLSLFQPDTTKCFKQNAWKLPSAIVFGIQNFLTQGPILYILYCFEYFTGPGPGTYMLPPVVGPSTAPNKHKAPQYSIKLPLKHKYNDAPAPGYVPADNKLPAVTVKGRNFYDPSEYQKKRSKTEKREIESYPLPSASTGLVLTR